MNKTNTQAIIIRRVNYGESARIVTFITKDQGKVSAMAKGVRKPKSKLAGGLELLSISNIGLLKGQGKLHQLVSARLVKFYDSILGDYDRLQLAYKAVELVDKLTENDSGPEYFEFVKEVFEELADEETQQEVVETWLRLELLKIAGHLPNLSTDCSGKKLAQSSRYIFDHKSGCFELSDQGAFGADHIKAWRLLATTKPSAIKQVRGLESVAKDSNKPLRNFYRYQLHL